MKMHAGFKTSLDWHKSIILKSHKHGIKWEKHPKQPRVKFKRPWPCYGTITTQQEQQNYNDVNNNLDGIEDYNSDNFGDENEDIR